MNLQSQIDTHLSKNEEDLLKQTVSPKVMPF